MILEMGASYGSEIVLKSAAERHNAMINIFISFLNNLPTEFILVLEFFTLFSVLMTLIYFFREAGLFIFIVISMITANLQVLKLVEYSFYPEPIALGKMAICFTFLSSDILAECFGKKSAYKGVYIGFSANLGLMLLMLITIGYPPLSVSKGGNFHDHLKLIFTPIPGVFFAGVVSYVISQVIDISTFLKLKDYFKGKYVWIRTFSSTVLASFFDNIIFYTLAFYVLNDFSIDFKTLIYSYILGTFIFRVFIITFSSTIMYAAKLVLATPEHSSIFDIVKTIAFFKKNNLLKAGD